MRRSIKQKLQRRPRILRWLPWVLLSLVSVTATTTDILMMLSTRRALGEQAAAILELEQVAVAQYELFQAHVKQCNCSCNSVEHL